MEDKNLQEAVNVIVSTLKAQHAEQFNWSRSIYSNQQNLKKALGITDASMPWEPYYNRSVPLNSKEPEIYNKYGERLRVLFLSDRESAHGVYGGGRYLYFDRYNYGLKKHFYTQDEAFRVVGKPDKKFAALVESRAIKPQSYINYLKNKNYIENDFEFVFSYDAEILNGLKNAKFAPLCANIWYEKSSLLMEKKKCTTKEVNTLGGGVFASRKL